MRQLEELEKEIDEWLVVQMGELGGFTRANFELSLERLSRRVRAELLRRYRGLGWQVASLQAGLHFILE